MGQWWPVLWGSQQVCPQCRRVLKQQLPILAAHCRPERPQLLRAATTGLLLVSCTAKGQQMHGEIGTEARLIRQLSGVRAQLAGPSALLGRRLRLPSSHAQMPLAGMYADGELGPHVVGATGVGWRWSQPQDGKAQQAGGSKLQGFTTIVTCVGSA